MAEHCDECGVFQRRVALVDGSEGWLCLNCSEDPVIEAVSDIRSELGLDPRDDICAFAFGLAEVQESHGSPRVTAASCIYLGSILADGEKLTQAAIAEAADISTSAIRQSYREVYESSGYADAFGEIAAGGRHPEEPNPVIDVDGWRDHLEAKGATDGAVKTAASNVRRFAKWYAGEGDPTAEDVADWLEYLAGEGYSPSTINSRWADMRQYFEWAGLGELTDDDVDLDDHIVTAYRQKA